MLRFSLQAVQFQTARLVNGLTGYQIYKYRRQQAFLNWEFM